MSAGIDQTAWQSLSGFAHVRQSVDVILRTRIGARVMRREFGSELMDLIDRPFSDRVILALYTAVVLAIARWEPRFAVTGCQVTEADETGRIRLDLSGLYYPKGHLGDFTVSSDQSASFTFQKTR